MEQNSVTLPKKLSNCVASDKQNETHNETQLAPDEWVEDQQDDHTLDEYSEFAHFSDSNNCSEQFDGEVYEHPILKAAEKGQLTLVKQLLRKEPSSVYAADVDGYTALHRASYNNRIEVVKCLIENGANISAQTIDGWQAIHSAAQWGHVHVFRILLSSGADVNARSNGGNTPFHLAVSRPSNHSLIEYMLYSDEVDIEAKNDASDTAFDICKRNSRLYKLWDLL